MWRKGGSHCCFDRACQTVNARAECAQCHAAWYCGKGCQRNDWERHKKACRAAAKDSKGKSAKVYSSHFCFDPACQAVGARAECAQCHSAWYCGKACQRNDWKRHKKGCRAAVAASARAATRQREAREARETRGGQRDENEVCVICCGPPAEPVEVRGARAPAAPE